MSTRVLIVEDYGDIALIYRTALDSAGYEVDLAKDGVEATYMADKNDYDLIILDMMLPYKSGMEFLKSVDFQEKKKKPKIIAVSNVATKPLVSETVHQGVDMFLEKAHITPNSLLKTVAQLLDTKPEKQS